MGRTVRGNVPAMVRAAHQYLFYRDEEAKAKKMKEQAVSVPGNKKGHLLKEYITEHGVTNDDGHVDWLFKEPITIGTVTYLGLRNQATEVTTMDEEAAQALVTKKGLRGAVVKTVEVWDYEELYRLNQKDLITDDEIDSLMATDTSYSLVVIK